ncbi:MAG: Na/Pi cotransporter family protein [Magnetovibrio sp.]|nr:Na/Pi cotransporter family protein [Magnetovibrio sp.]
MGAGTLGLFNLIGGVAALLWGLRMVRTGAMRALGGQLRLAIRRSTSNRFTAALTGAGLTALVQSSTAVVLLIASFASRGLIKTGPALATVLGADVGTTVVAQVLSFDLSFLSPLCVTVGLIIFMMAQRKGTRNIGRILLGLGLMLLALKQIVGASSPMRESELIQQLISALQDELLLAMVLAIIMTWLSHSSLAMVLLVMSLAASGHVPVDLALVLVLGINVGGTLPAISATVGGALEGRWVAVGNLLFRVTGALLAFPLLDFVGPYLAEFESAPARQIANFHTLFNVALALSFIMFTEVMARLVERFMPRPAFDPNAPDQPMQPLYLNEDQVGNIGQALANASREALRMGDVVYRMLELSIEAFKSHDVTSIKAIERMDDDVDRLNEAVKFYATEISRGKLTRRESERCMTIVHYVTNLEHVGDLIDRNLMELAAVKQKKGLGFSGEGQHDIDVLHERLMANLQMSFNLFLSQDEGLATELLSEKRAFRDAQIDACQRHFERLRRGTAESMETSAIHMDLLRDFKQINSHITALSYSILDVGGRGPMAYDMGAQ